jgi:hypothetical protein
MANCNWCNKPFFANRDWQRFCCKEHQQRWHRREQRLANARPFTADRDALAKAVAGITEGKPDFFFKPKPVPAELAEALMPKRKPLKRRV